MNPPNDESGCQSGYDITFSVVSHGQGNLIRSLLDDLSLISRHSFEVLLTVNIAEDEAYIGNRPFPLTVIRNSDPKGFGANHNAAFRVASGRYFFVVNPDIRLLGFDFSHAFSLFTRADVAAVVPKVLGPTGHVEDSVRRFPTPFKLIRRLLWDRGRDVYAWSTQPFEVEWAAGMFIILRPAAFTHMSGFDEERYFMYFEDVDLCWRLRCSGWVVVADPAISVEHHARRAARKSVLHFSWFVSSALKFFLRKYSILWRRDNRRSNAG
jgi:N-acetylglucosaminyl-diphospho-decaprenol L-rhamnosyltransferase